MSRRTKTTKARRWIEAFLLLAGLIAVGIWGWSYARRAVYQAWGNLVLNRRIENRPATISPPSAAPQAKAPPLRNGALIGRLTIPRLDMRAVVREGAGQDTLDVALGHIPGTALPGQSGNVGVAGHRDTLFRGLRKIEKDDLIEFQTSAASYNYKVESTRIVKPDDVAVLRASGHSEMTLVTCYPFYYVGSAPDRFIVKARLVEAPTATAPTPPDLPSHDRQGMVASNNSVPSHDRQGVVASNNSVPSANNSVPSHDRQGVVRVNATTPPRPLSTPAVRRVSFQLSANNSRQVVPGIRLGVSSADPARGRATVWMYMTPEGRTISLKNQPAHQAVFFHGHDDSKQREFMITRVAANSVTGYLLLYGSARGDARPLRNQ